MGLTAAALRPWHRLAVRLATVFALLTLVTIGMVGVLVRERQKAEVEDAVGTQLLNIARIGALLIDPAAHAGLPPEDGTRSEAYRRLRTSLAAIQSEALLTTPIRTLTDYDGNTRRARIAVTTSDTEHPGQPYPLAREVGEAMAWSFEDGVARYTRIYHDAGSARISAVAPVVDRAGRAIAMLHLDYEVELYFDRLRELDATIVRGSLAGALVAVLLGLVFARRLTRPISALTGAVARVAAGDLSTALPVRSRDEIGVLTGAFNEMLEGLRQRDFIRTAFGRYVSPEVVKTLLDSPDGLRLGGQKREVTVLMSDLRGYTRFAEHGDPAAVMTVLNEYLGRMADVVIAHGGTINEFIGDAIFAVFGAPVAHADHAERAAAAALAMVRAMDELNTVNARRGQPRFEMGIGISTGEAVVGNIGSEQRTKYAVVGAAVNLAARVEGCTVGGQILLSASAAERLRGTAELAASITADLKGFDTPVLLYELRGLRGRFAQRLDEAADDGVEVGLPLAGSVIDGKRLQADTFSGIVRELSHRRLEAVLDTGLAALTNVRLRLTFPDSRPSDAVYGKVTGHAERAGGRLTTIHLTSVTPADRQRLDRLLEAGVESHEVDGVSKTVR